MHKNIEDTIDKIYECAYIPELWPTVLDDLSEKTGAWGGMLFTATPYATRWIASDSTSKFFDQFLNNGWMQRNPLVERGIRKDHAGFLTDLDLFSMDELDEEPMYQDMRRLGGGWHLGTAIAVPNGDTLVINIERQHNQGPFNRQQAEYLDVLRPHLCRAALLAARSNEIRTNAVIESLTMLKIAAGILNSKGRLLSANTLLLSKIPSLIEDFPSRLKIKNAQSDRIFAKLMDNFASKNQIFHGKSIPVPASNIRLPSIIHIIPTKGASRDIFAADSFLIVITDVEIGKVPDAQLVRGLFDLTPAESKIAQEIARGLGIPEISNIYSTSNNTIKSQVKSIFDKTGVKKQSELSALLNGVISI